MLYSVKMRSNLGGVHGVGGRHISGAERIVADEVLDEEVLSMIHRARCHDRGSADFIQVKVEAVEENQISYVPLLGFYQVDTTTKEEGRQAARKELARIGVSDAAISKGFALLDALTDSVRGAMVLDAVSGERLDDLAERGVRCSNMDIEDSSTYEGKMKAAGHGGTHAREAMVLASKVAYAPGAVAELCWSDDPHYVTGYVASKKFGYGRIMVLKDLGDPVGGRIFFVKPGTDMKAYEDYLQNQVVLVRMNDED